MKNVYVAKNVSLEYKNFNTILGYANGKRLSFSRALNEIVSQWDKISLEFMKINAKEQVKDLKNAEVIKYQEKQDTTKSKTQKKM